MSPGENVYQIFMEATLLSRILWSTSQAKILLWYFSLFLFSYFTFTFTDFYLFVKENQFKVIPILSSLTKFSHKHKRRVKSLTGSIGEPLKIAWIIHVKSDWLLSSMALLVHWIVQTFCYSGETYYKWKAKKNCLLLTKLILLILCLRLKYRIKCPFYQGISFHHFDWSSFFHSIVFNWCFSGTKKFF